MTTRDGLEPDDGFDALSRRLRLAQIAVMRQQLRVIVVLEGFDASGKGGLIRELAYAWDPRGYSVYPIGPPTAIEAAQPFLWRFWQRLPAPGQIAVFDRSWYGRLLVERVEFGLPEAQVDASVAEINAFERMLTHEGVRVLKFFMDISHKTQALRLKRRAERPDKRWKLTASDLDAHARYAEYRVAIEDMMGRCQAVPWVRVDANDKARAREEVMQSLVSTLGQVVRPRTFSFNPGVEARLGELDLPTDRI